MRRYIPVLLLLLAGSSQAQVTQLFDLYKTLRPAICGLLNINNPADIKNCKLPDIKDIVAPVTFDNDVVPLLNSTNQAVVIGQLSLVKDDVLRTLLVRGMQPSQNTVSVYYGSLKEDTDLLNKAIQAAQPPSLSLVSITLPSVDVARTVTRIPFLFVSGKVFVKLQDPTGQALWLVISGQIARNVTAVATAGTPYLAEASEREKKLAEEERSIK